MIGLPNHRIQHEIHTRDWADWKTASTVAKVSENQEDVLRDELELGGEPVTNLDVAAGDMRRNVLLDPAVKISRIDAD